MRRLELFLLTLCVALAPISLRAETITVAFDPPPNIVLPYNATSDQTGSFEIYAKVENSLGHLISGTDIRLEIQEQNQGLIFTGISKPVDHSYLFGTENITASQFDNYTALLSHLTFSYPTLIDGKGLMKVSYKLAAGASGTFHINYTLAQIDDDALPDPNHLNLTLASGVITVVPEPCSWVLLSTLFVMLIPGVCRRLAIHRA
jgi:hypothetical protein